MILLVGVTFFFAIAQANGTIDYVIEAVLARLGDNAVVLPFLFFTLTTGISAMGSPLAGLVVAPIGMPAAKKYGMDPMLMALAIGCGLSAGAFAPTSLFGSVTYGTAHQANIDLSPLTLFAVAGSTNILLLTVAFFIFGGPKLFTRRRASSASLASSSSRLSGGVDEWRRKGSVELETASGVTAAAAVAMELRGDTSRASLGETRSQPYFA